MVSFDGCNLLNEWKAWDEHANVYSSSEYQWEELPDGIIGVILYLDPPYRRIIDGHDWIWVEDGEFHRIETNPEWGKWNNPPEHVPRQHLKKGAGVSNALWKRVQQEMLRDKQWP